MPSTTNSLFLNQLGSIVGADHLFTDADKLQPSLTEPRGLYQGSAMALVRPATAGEVVNIVKTCAAAGVPMVPQSGNTSLCGGATAMSSQTIVLNLSRLTQIRQLDSTANSLVAEAGCIIANIQQAASEAGRLFPLSFAADGSAMIGGAIGTNAGGTNVLRYGNTRELVSGLEVVLANGDLLDDLRGLRKDNTGYDLTNLFIGAEGTLGIVTAAKLKLFAAPAQCHTAWLAIDQISAGIDLLSDLQQLSDGAVSGCELMSSTSLQFALRHQPGARAPMTTQAPWYLLLELTASDHFPLASLLEKRLSQALDDGQVRDVVIAQSLQQGEDFWAIREAISAAQKHEGGSIKHDIALPIQRLAKFVDATLPLLGQKLTDIRPCIFGHLGDGNLHFNLSQPVEMETSEFLAQWSEFNRLVHDQVDKFGGSISAEHGIGQLKREELVRYKSPVALQLMRQIKRALDPDDLMNPGKLLPDK
ncbi:MAG: FAD-binding oxidoreductase [Immundisolibacteraceae bacterium]|nr:FAD-binding oxidoreductase [Immundisolibacteraceae bacterium]